MKRFSPPTAEKSFTEPINLLTNEGLTSQSENINRAKHDDKSDYLVNISDEENQQNYGLNTGSEGRKTPVIILLFLLSLSVLLLAPFMGMTNISPIDVLKGTDEEAARILLELRIPRVLLAWVTGATLALCGLIFQALFRNPLASPDMLGVSSGAAFGAVLYIRAGITFSILGVIPGISLAAFAGALTATLAIYGAGNLRQSSMSDASLLLAGIAMSFLFASLNMIVQYSSGYVDTFRMMRWSMGGMQTVGFASAAAALPGLLLIFIIAFAASCELNLIVCGDEIAMSRGVSAARLKGLCFLSVSLVMGLNVALCGPIGFVGLMAPHIARKLAGADYRVLSVVSPLFGGAFLVICDTAARMLWSPSELPVGILTSCLGSVFFLCLLMKGKR